MTSKKALNELKGIESKQNYGNGDLWLKMYLDAIEKDLEVLEIIKDNFILYKDLYHEGKWQLTLKQKKVFVEGSKEYELLKEWLQSDK
jgi:hypothetical protein